MPRNYSKKNEARLRFFLEKKANDTAIEVKKKKKDEDPKRLRSI